MYKMVHQIKADYPFYILIFIYMLSAVLVASYVDDLKWFVPFVYVPEWLNAMITIGSVLTIVGALAALKHPRPFHAFRGQLSLFMQERLAGFVLFTAIALFYGTFTSMKMMMPEIAPFTADPLLSKFSTYLHFGRPAWEYLRFLNPYTQTIRFFYEYPWFLIMTGGTLCMCVARPGHLRSQYLWTFFLCWIMLGNIVALSFMSVGPVFYEALLQDNRYAELTSHLASLVTPENLSSQVPQMLWTAHVTKTPGFGHGISAFPSLHVSMATLFMLTAFKLRLWLGWCMTAYLFLIFTGSVHLGWHYAIDGYVSFLATSAMWLTVGAALRTAPKAFTPFAIASLWPGKTRWSTAPRGRPSQI